MTMALTVKGAARRRRKTEGLERPDYGWIWKPLLGLVVLYLLVTLALGIWWSRTPDPFDVERATAEQRGEEASEPASRGAVTTATLMTTLRTLLDKPGGYLRNDIAPPGLWLDNMPNWELGVVIQGRDLVRALPVMEERDVPALDAAHEQLMGDTRDWLYFSTEQRLEVAHESLGSYLASMGEGGNAGFVPGAGIAFWLDTVAGRLEDLGLRLSASVDSHERLRDLDIDTSELPPSTPWHRVDDIFHEARGSTWALIHLLEAVRRDQADVLEEAGAMGEWNLLVAELQRTQRPLWSPVVLNGSGFGIFANHSLVMANYVIRARDLARNLATRLEVLPDEAGVEPVSVEEQTAIEPPVEEVTRSEDPGLEAPTQPPAMEEESGPAEAPASSEETPQSEEAPSAEEEAPPAEEEAIPVEKDVTPAEEEATPAEEAASSTS
jgi:hypothetical protein